MRELGAAVAQVAQAMLVARRRVVGSRSEERRAGKGGRSRWSPYQQKKKAAVAQVEVAMAMAMAEVEAMATGCGQP
jgi:hypothetical protein